MARKNQKDPELIFWVREYLLHCSQVRMTNLATLRRMSTAFAEVAQSQVSIGWVEFLHGKVSRKFRKIQDAHCILSGSQINRGDWMCQFMERLLHILHSQWLYRNFTLHHYAKGYLCHRAEREIMDDMDWLTDTQPTDIPLESSYLLELPHRLQLSSTVPYKAYWVLAMRAAKANLRNKEKNMKNAKHAKARVQKEGLAQHPQRSAGITVQPHPTTYRRNEAELQQHAATRVR